MASQCCGKCGRPIFMTPKGWAHLSGRKEIRLGHVPEPTSVSEYLSNTRHGPLFCDHCGKRRGEAHKSNCRRRNH